MTSYVATRHFAHSRRLGIFAFFLAAASVWRQRRVLSRLDQHAMEDLGLTANDIAAESTRPLWDVPQNWRY